MCYRITFDKRMSMKHKNKLGCWVRIRGIGVTHGF